MDKRVVQIEDWQIRHLGRMDQSRLDGIVYGHPDPTAPDGFRLITGVLERFDPENGIAETKRTTYRLGKRAYS